MIKRNEVVMRADSVQGFNVVELAAVTAVVMLLVLALIPAVGSKLTACEMTPVGVRGREIFVAITGANTEREPLGLSPVWPSENPPVANNGPYDVECFNFSNSTDYFKCIYDEENAGTADWSPLAANFDYTRLEGAGVPPCTSGKLRPENNMWTIAMNVTDELDDTVPVLITRNIDASSLAAKVTDKDWDKPLRFDPEWETPFGNRAFALIRKGGAVFRARDKYASYKAVYQGQTFDASVDAQGHAVARPLKYLTPTRKVVPGEQTYIEGAVRNAQLTGDGFGISVRRDLAALDRVARSVGWLLAVIYLLAGVVYHVIVRDGTRRWPPLTGYGIGVGLFHYAAAVLWVSVFLGSLGGGSYGAFRWTLLVLALLAQAVGLAFAAWLRRDDRAARQRAMMCVVVVPLIAVGGLFLMLVLGAFR
jgi:hypothetical protein